MNPITHPTTNPTTNPTSEKIEATVTAFGHIQPSRYSNEQVQSVLFERWDRHDESRKIWKTFSVPEARQFHKNQRVLLVSTWRNNRQVWEVERLVEANRSSSPPYPKRSEYQEPEPQTQPPDYRNQPVHPHPRLKAQSSSLAPSSAPPMPNSTAPMTPTTTPETGRSSLNQTPELATWISGQADLYAFCFSEAQRALVAHQPGEETVRACASSLFISASRKFRLEA